VPTRIDLDNIAKIITDGANGIAWEDDRLIHELTLKKLYGEPRVEVSFS
jgi:Holliday junction resolvase RusA-like endonuclease